MPSSVFDRVESLLREQGIAVQVLRHEPVFTSEEAARVRGTPLASGANALICKVQDAFVMFVLPADRKLDSHAARQAKGWRKLRFATREEAEKNGRDLANRWILVNSFTVEESSDPVNYQWTDEGLKAVEPTAAADSAA